MFNYSDFVVLYFRNLTEQSNNKKNSLCYAEIFINHYKKDFKQLSAFLSKSVNLGTFLIQRIVRPFLPQKFLPAKLFQAIPYFATTSILPPPAKPVYSKKSASKVGFRCTIYFTRGLCYLNCRKAPERCSTKSEATKEASLCKPAKISPDKPCI